MSKTSAKQRYQQLKEWLGTKKTTKSNRRNTGGKFSKADTYNGRRQFQFHTRGSTRDMGNKII